MSKPLTKRDPRKGQLLYTRAECAELLSIGLTTFDEMRAANEIEAIEYPYIGLRVRHEQLVKFFGHDLFAEQNPHIINSLWTRQQAANMLACGLTALDTLRKRGEISASADLEKMGIVRFPHASLRRFVEHHTVLAA